ncbi:MAG: exodeoxyribonuclease V subunit beta [Proteobacteria bacterium]|nr:exodeoxyribonuclease V subunit beta [Pseudomonadota bacterium]HQR03216.1 exodeoxyribonuclease V subunit beta [Rhodocyclaceae bacterium]
MTPSTSAPVSAPLAATLTLEGFQAIEASAGTGKTWSIAALYLRLVVERELPVERILVVTYTKGATAELRRRIRERLVEARKVFVNGTVATCGDEVLTGIAGAVTAERAVALLTLAVESFDLAAVFTIHGFCQRALAERAFESGQPFDAELLTDEAPLLHAVVRDFWRLELEGADAAWAGWLLKKVPGPDALLDLLRPHLGKPYLHRILPPPWDPAAEDTLAVCRTEVATIWAARRGIVLSKLDESDALNRNIYKQASITKHAVAMEAWFANGGDAPENSIELFTPAKLKYGTKSGKDAFTPEDALFPAMQTLLDAVRSAAGQRKHRLGLWLQRALVRCEALLAERKQRLNRQSFDDLLTHLAAALQGEGGEVLAASLQARYRAALIDEFQDTDPVQYDIFERVFRRGGLPLFFVGDPKQAIYGFRGADLETYLVARTRADSIHNLRKNWRSTPSLVAAVNTIFMRRTPPFLDDRLHFIPVEAERPASLEVSGRPPAPLSICFLPRNEDEKLITKDSAIARITDAIARDIASLLAAGARREASVEGKPLQGGDVAILVKSHHQGRKVHAALKAHGVGSVLYGQDSIFKSHEALELERLLRAVAEPARMGRVRAALATDLLGRDGAALFALEQDAAAWEVVLHRFAEWHALCRDRGFVVMWRHLLVQESVAERMMAWPDGERRMTNLQHLGEILQSLAHEENLGAEALASRLAEARSGSNEGFDADTALLRLESDEGLVRVVTVHSAKGLEYPVVYCPFLWDGGKPKDQGGPLRFHDEEHRPALDFGSADIEQHRIVAEEERRQELLRLAYVALTRARHRCVVAWGGIKDADRSALAWLLHGVTPTEFPKLGDCDLQHDLAALARACPHIEITGLPEGSPEPASSATISGAQPLHAARFAGNIPSHWLTHSFTAWLAAGDTAFVHERPDHDAAASLSNVVDAAMSHPEGSAMSAPVLDFPRGAAVGSALHHLFEVGDFAAFDTTAIPATLRQFGIEEHWAPQAASLVQAALKADLGGGLRLCEVPRARQLRELEFLFPIARPDVSALARAIGPGQGADGSLARRVVHLQPARVAGYLKGYIDLAFEHEGRLWLLDYKSNWLGSHVADYAAGSVAAAMSGENYDLQALLYTVALHRLSALRRPGYAYETHMGGALYLFLRGLPDDGVFRWLPDAALVQRVDACLQGQEIGG